jgi:hypothetical protein
MKNKALGSIVRSDRLLEHNPSVAQKSLAGPGQSTVLSQLNPKEVDRAAAKVSWNSTIAALPKYCRACQHYKSNKTRVTCATRITAAFPACLMTGPFQMRDRYNRKGPCFNTS